MKNVINLICMLLFLGLGSFFYLVFAEEGKEEGDDRRTTIVAMCGTSSFNSSPAHAQEGKTLFRNYCASCHDKTMTRHMTGPPLRNFTNMWNSDTLLILDYLRDSETFLDTSSLARSQYLKIEYKDIGSHGFVNFTKEELRDLMTYINL